MTDGCAGCIALKNEAGEHAELYSRKLPIRGWAGKLSEGERLFLRHHAPEWYRLALARVPGSATKQREQRLSGAEDGREGVAHEQAA